MHQHSDNSMAIVATFHARSKADAFGKYLQNHGVEMEVSDERRLQRYWFWARPRAGIHVSVLKKDLSRVEQLLKQWEASVTPSTRAIHCPACDSSRVQYPQMTRRFILPTLVAQVAVRLGLLGQEYYCEHCHHTWTKSSRKGARKDHNVQGTVATASPRGQ